MPALIRGRSARLSVCRLRRRGFGGMPNRLAFQLLQRPPAAKNPLTTQCGSSCGSSRKATIFEAASGRIVVSGEPSPDGSGAGRSQSRTVKPEQRLRCESSLQARRLNPAAPVGQLKRPDDPANRWLSSQKMRIGRGLLCTWDLASLLSGIPAPSGGAAPGGPLSVFDLGSKP